MNSKKHPVWGLYNTLRTARLNVKYYSIKLHRAKTLSVWMNVIVATTAPGSTLAGIFLWETTIGDVLWKCLGIVAALVGLTRPFLGLEENIANYKALTEGFQGYYYDLDVIREKVFQQDAYDKPLQDKFLEAIEKYRSVVIAVDGSKEDKNLIRKCFTEVNQELPPESFHIPAH